MKSHSRQAEAVGRANRLKASTVPAFATPEYGEWKPGGNPAGYFKCEILGIEVKLRLGMVWTAYCPHFDIQVQFTNRPDSAMVIFLADWLTAHIEAPQSPAKLRQATPAVLDMAQRHNISPALALEFYEERGR